MDLNKKFALTIMGLRTNGETKLSQTDVASDADISLKYYAKLEKGLGNPSLKVIENIAAVYGLKSWELLKKMED